MHTALYFASGAALFGALVVAVLLHGHDTD
jgi:hypothetical protein